MNRKLFVCDCGDPEHQFIVSKSPEYNELLVSIHLSRLPFIWRLRNGILYILGKQSNYGAFGEIILNKENIQELHNITKEFLEENVVS